MIIGIYPEWNVKSNIFLVFPVNHTIGIYPEWNVKAASPSFAIAPPTDWNISKMECKV